MALRLGGLVRYGELFATRKNSVHGWLKLRGEREPMAFELTGACCPDLEGKRIRFAPRRSGNAFAFAQEKTSIDPRRVPFHQIGPTGIMTAARRVKVPTVPCTVEQFCEMMKAGQPPPMEYKRCLYLEWFSQNGCVVIEMADPILVMADDPDAGEPDWIPVPEPDWEQLAGGGAGGGGLQLPLSIPEEDEEPVERTSLESQLDDYLERLSQEQDQSAGLSSGEPEKDAGDPMSKLDPNDPVYELELMDRLIGTEKGQPLRMFFGADAPILDPDALTDDQVETALKILLARLALHGIALHICEHYTLRDAYRLLLDELGREGRAMRQLRGTGWVQNYMTSEYCEACDREIEEKYHNSSPAEPEE